MTNYPLSGTYPKNLIHTLEIELQHDEFKGTIRHQIVGTELGSSILQSAISVIEDMDYEPRDEESKKFVLIDDEGYFRGFRLYDENGDDLILNECNDLADCVVGVRIIEAVPYKAFEKVTS